MVRFSPQQEEALHHFEPMLEPIVAAETAAEKRVRHRAVDMDLQEEDWKAFLAGAKQRTYKKGEYVLQEGKPTAALYQIVRGTLRVELQLPDQPQAVVVGYRKAGEMFGETSLLQAPPAPPRTPRPAPRAPHPPEQMVAANATYGWLHAYRDDPMFVTGLWETAADHLKELALDERCVQRWVPQGSPAG
jgi:hypothetical protein